MKSTLGLTVVVTAGLLVTAACGGEDGGGGSGGDIDARGPITIWLSNNQEELAWGKSMVKAWNAENPDEEVTAQELPTGKSSEAVIGAAITAGNAPCVILNVAPVAVSKFQKQGGLVALDSFEDGASYVEERTGEVAEQYKSSDGKFYQLPWKSNPVMIFYNKEMFTQAGIDAENPPLSTYDDFHATAKTIVDSGAADAAIWPAPTNEFFQSWFDFYPLYAAQSQGELLVEDGEATFDSEAGTEVANLWKQMYDEGLSPKEAPTGDAFADEKSAMAIVGPWAIAVYEDIDWGVVPVPTKDGMPAEEIYTFSDAKNMALFTACENQGTAWDVMQFATSQEQDQALLEKTGQMPFRTDLPTTYSDYFEANPEYQTFADQAGRTVDVPNVPNSIEIWQTVRDVWSEAVIFGKGDVKSALSKAADTVTDLAGEN